MQLTNDLAIVATEKSSGNSNTAVVELHSFEQVHSGAVEQILLGGFLHNCPTTIITSKCFITVSLILIQNG